MGGEEGSYSNGYVTEQQAQGRGLNPHRGSAWREDHACDPLQSVHQFSTDVRHTETLQSYRHNSKSNIGVNKQTLVIKDG